MTPTEMQSVVLLSGPRLRTKFGASPAFFRAGTAQRTIWIRDGSSGASHDFDNSVHHHSGGSYRLLTAPSRFARNVERGMDRASGASECLTAFPAGRREQRQPAKLANEAVGNGLTHSSTLSITDASQSGRAPRCELQGALQLGPADRWAEGQQLESVRLSNAKEVRARSACGLVSPFHLVPASDAGAASTVS